MTIYPFFRTIDKDMSWREMLWGPPHQSLKCRNWLGVSCHLACLHSYWLLSYLRAYWRHWPRIAGRERHGYSIQSFVNDLFLVASWSSSVDHPFKSWGPTCDRKYLKAFQACLGRSFYRRVSPHFGTARGNHLLLVSILFATASQVF